MSLSWDENLVLGNTEIDDQHKEIFARFDKLSLACQEQHGADVLKELLEYLDDYVANHFAAEESLMERSGYPGLGVQREQHTEFRRILAEMQARNMDDADDAEKHRLSLDVDRLLIQWFIRHIRSLDGMFVEFVKTQK